MQTQKEIATQVYLQSQSSFCVYSALVRVVIDIAKVSFAISITSIAY
jgi:hypothetical protein